MKPISILKLNFHFALPALFVAASLSACQSEVPTAQTQPQMTDEEIVLSGLTETDQTFAIMYVTPRQSSSCERIEVILNYESYNGIETSWDVHSSDSITRRHGGPEGLRDIKDQPLYFNVTEPGRYKVWGIGCKPYGLETSYATGDYAVFEPAPGKINYIGDFKQHMINEALEIYEPQDAIITRRAQFEQYMPELAPSLSVPESNQPYTFENHDGEIMMVSEVIANNNGSADYYFYSLGLLYVSEAAIEPFMTFYPDAEGRGFASFDAIENYFSGKLDYLRESTDNYLEYTALIKSGVPFDVVKRYLASDLTSQEFKKYKLKTHLKLVESELRDDSMKRMKAQLPGMVRDMRRSFTTEDIIRRTEARNRIMAFSEAKYDFLISEQQILQSLPGADLSKYRAIIKQMKTAQILEVESVKIYLEEFGIKDLSKNETYQKSRKDLWDTWDEIIFMMNDL